jgi:hypothetical protein
MSKFKFISEDCGYTNTLEFEAVGLSSVVEGFEQFLKGSGFQFDGKLDLCNITEPWPEKECDNNCGGCVCESSDNTITMPFQTGTATLTFPEERCKVCKLTREQLGDHACWDNNCGLK